MTDTKYYCDICGDELNSYQDEHSKRQICCYDWDEDGIRVTLNLCDKCFYQTVAQMLFPLDKLSIDEEAKRHLAQIIRGDIGDSLITGWKGAIVFSRESRYGKEAIKRCKQGWRKLFRKIWRYAIG